MGPNSSLRRSVRTYPEKRLGGGRSRFHKSIPAFDVLHDSGSNKSVFLVREAASHHSAICPLDKGFEPLICSVRNKPRHVGIFLFWAVWVEAVVCILECFDEGILTFLGDEQVVRREASLPSVDDLAPELYSKHTSGYRLGTSAE